jgi:hypothetical protein
MDEGTQSPFCVDFDCWLMNTEELARKNNDIENIGSIDQTDIEASAGVTEVERLETTSTPSRSICTKKPTSWSANSAGRGPPTEIYCRLEVITV